MVSFLLGQQSGYTKFPCFLCYWVSRDKANYWKIKNWPVREQLKVGDRNVRHDQFVPREKIIFPHLHIKLGLINSFSKVLIKMDNLFNIFRQLFQDGPTRN